MRGTVGRRRIAAIAAMFVLASFACAGDDTTDGRGSTPERSPTVDREEQALTEDAYLERVDDLCTYQSEVVKLAQSADSREEFVQALASHFDETITFIESLKKLAPPAAYEEDHSAFIAHQEELQEIDELLNQLPRSDAPSVLAALARRAEIAEEVHYVVKFSELPSNCLFQREEEVLTVGFFTQANLSCFNFATDLAVLFQQEANQQRQRSFGAEFIGLVHDRAEQLITELDTAVPDVSGFKKIFNMITLYSTGVESLGNLQQALARDDVGAGTAAINEYNKAIDEGDRLARDLRMACMGAMQIDWRPVNRVRIN